jgi:vacuolar-type H+-ATPase subunit E/Vma4
LRSGLNEVGEGELQVYADIADFERIDQIKSRLNKAFTLEQSDEPLLGGCIVVNRATGLMADYSFSTRLKQQRETFLEMSGMNINL